MWKIKVVIQFILSKIPFGVKLNYRLQRTRQEQIDKTMEGRVIGLVKKMKLINEYVPFENAVVVEVGTGWEPICAMLIYLMGAARCHTYDHIKHVRFNLANKIISIIEKQLPEISAESSIPLAVLEERIARIKNCTSLDEIFTKANIFYHAPGDATNTQLDDKSVDLVYSNAVLEHVPEKVVVDLTIESKRILKPLGKAYHLIGLHDHYVSVDKSISRVNFLQYSETMWAFFVKNKISYHNRLREKQFFDIFKKYGGHIEWSDHRLAEKDIEAVKKMKVHPYFKGMTVEELAVTTTEVIISF